MKERNNIMDPQKTLLDQLFLWTFRVMTAISSWTFRVKERNMGVSKKSVSWTSTFVTMVLQET